MTKVRAGYSLDHAYLFFKENNTQLCEEHGITLQKYRDICKDFNKLIIEEAVETGNGVRLPFRCGMLWVKKFKTNWNKPPINFKLTRELGKTVYHTNVHSDGWSCRWFWSKDNTAFKNLIYYNFVPTKTNTKTASAVMFLDGGHKRFLTQQTY